MDEDLSDSTIADYREAFKAFDKDGDGFITAPELACIMQSQGRNPTEEEVRALMGFVDKDGDGTIDFEEFLVMVTKNITRENDTEYELRQAFRLLDTDDNGYITESEMRKVVSQLNVNLSAADIDRILDEADMDMDGKVSFEEFVLLMTPK